MLRRYRKIEIDRVRNKWNLWLWQPLMLLFFIALILLGKATDNYMVYSTMILSFAMMSIFYLYVNFIKKSNKIYCEVREDELILVELDNPFSKKIICQISALNWLWIKQNYIFGIPTSKKLECLYGENGYTLIKMNSFWYGDVSNENVQELIFYLVQYNPTVVVDESLNEV